MKRCAVSIFTFLLLSSVLLVAQASSSGLVMPHVAPSMLQADFWISKLTEPDKVLMNQSQINLFNQETAASLPNKMYDLRQYPREVSRNTLVDMIAVPKLLEKPRYVNGQPATQDYYAALTAQCNLVGIAPVTQVRYGITVTRANMRTFPTTDCITSQSDDSEFDLLQETAVDPAEPVIILHESTNRAWYFIQMVNYQGWLPANVVAVAGARQEWLEYVEPAEFLTVIASKLKVGDMEFAMGAKLPLAERQSSALLIDRLAAGGKYVVRLPVRGPKGELVFELAAVTADSHVAKGVLPYTRAAVLSQVFKLQGERYGWGGLNGGWDCSSLVLDVYRCFGFTLPRNADEQEQTAGGTVNFAGSNRVSLLTGLEPGAAVYMPGHAMIYLGEHDARQYIIHALGGYSIASGRVPVMRVVVSDLSLTLKSGKTYLEALTVGKQFQ